MSVEADITAGSTQGSAQCAAVLLMLLDEAEAASLLEHLGPDELRAVSSAMHALGEVDEPEIADAIACFSAQTQSEALPGNRREGQLRSMIHRAVGSVRAQGILDSVIEPQRSGSIEIARWLAPRVLVSLIEREHPQMVAALLLLLEPERAAQALALLPQVMQPDVVARIARMRQVPGTAVEMLDRLLTDGISRRFGSSVLTLGGPREAANLINLAEGEVANTVLPGIELKDADLARRIEDEMVTLDMVLALDAQSMGRLLRDIDNEVLVDALKGMNEEQRAPMFAAMSSRAADGVRDEIELRGRVRKEAVTEAQRRLVEQARKLADEGEIMLGGGGGDFV